MSDRCEVHDFLHGRLAQQCGAGLTAGIDVGMITENVQCMCSHAAGGNVENAGKLLTGNLIDIRDHQKKTL